MSAYVEDPMAALLERTARCRRVNIRTSKKAIPSEIHQLQRAFDRATTQPCEAVAAVLVSANRGCFLVVMETVAAGQGVIAKCEELFTEAWYDAFGQRNCPHVWWVDDAPRLAPEPDDKGAPPPPAAVSESNPGRAASIRKAVFSILDAAHSLSDDREPARAREREELEADVDALRACADLIESVLGTPES